MLLLDYMKGEYAAPAVYYLAEILEIGSEEEVEKMEKSALLKQEAELLLTPDMMARRLSVLTDRQMELFELACRKPMDLTEDEREDGRELSGCRYAFLVSVGENDDMPLPSIESPSDEQKVLLDTLKALKRFSYRRLEIPEDVVSLYKTVNTPEFQERRRIASRLVSCLDASRDLYGSVPVSVIRRILEQELDAEISETKILSLFDSLPSDCKYSVYDRETGRIHYRRIQDTELAELLHEQEGKDFYIPTLSEMKELYEHGFPSNSVAYTHYRMFLENHCGFTPDDSGLAASELWKDISERKPHQECVQAIIDSCGADSSCAKLLLTLYRNCYNETRFPIHCGHTPLEMAAKYPDTPLSDSPRKFDMAFDDSVKPVKIGRNAPCPCGSGKKYKKCCMR